MSVYEELVERCGQIIECGWDRDGYWPTEIKSLSESVLAEVLRTLETVTPEMVAAADDAGGELWHPMLRASPLAPPAGAP